MINTQNTSRILLFIAGIIIMISLSSYSHLLTDGQSIIVVKLKYSTSASTGFGGGLIIKNIETGAIYENKLKIGVNPYAIIENLPTGNYIVEEVQMPTGMRNHALYFNKRVTDYDTIHIDKPRIYY